jgi:hypothetical protein
MSRAVQALILIGGVLLLVAALFGARGPVLIGVGVFLSAFPPARRYVDRWLVGTSKGEEADEAAILRIAAGAGIVILALILAPG